MSLDDFMRAMWERFGRPGGRREGYVDRPYTTDDAETVLGEVSGDRGFAREFFSRYIRGRDAADYPALLERAGLAVRRRHPGRAWLGDVRLIARDGARVSTLVAPTWPVYAAGLDQDDELQDVAGRRVNDDSDLAAALARHGPGDRVRIVFVDRSGRSRTATVTPTAPQRAFRDRWLGDKGGRGETGRIGRTKPN